MFPIRFVLILSVTLIRVGSNDVSGYYVIPYGFDNPYEPVPEVEIPTTTPEPTIITMPPPPPPTELPPRPFPPTPSPLTAPPPVITTTPPQPPSPTVTMTMTPTVTTEIPPIITAPPPSPPPPPMKMTCVCDCNGVPERGPYDPYPVKYYRQYNYYYPNSNRIPIPMPRPEPNICELCYIRNRSQPFGDPPMRPSIPPPYPFIPNPYREPELMPPRPNGPDHAPGPIKLPVPEPEPEVEPEPEPSPVPKPEPSPVPEPEPVPEPLVLPFPPHRYGYMPNGLVDPRVSVQPIGDPSMRSDMFPPFPYIRNTYGQSGVILQQNVPYQIPPPIELIDPIPLPVPEPAPEPSCSSCKNRLRFRQSAPLRNPLTGQIKFIDPIQGPPSGPASVPAMPQIDPLVPTFPGPNDRLTLLPDGVSPYFGPQSAIIPRGFPPVPLTNVNPLWYNYPPSANQLPNYSMVV